MVSHLTQSEWDSVEESAESGFVKAIGERPTRRSVAKDLYNPYSISLLEWLGLILLLFIAIVTGYKMVAVAVPFADSFYAGVDNGWVRSFEIFMSITFVLFSTSGLVYYKLMDEYDEEIQKQKAKYPRLKFTGGWQGAVGTAVIIGFITSVIFGYDLEVTGWASLAGFFVALYLGGIPSNLLQYVSPRLYQWLTYITVIWLLLVSSHGDGSFFDRYAIVIAEVALAYLVANLIQKRNAWTETVHKAWKEAVAPYDKRLKNKRSDALYLEILFRELRDAMMNVYRKTERGKRVKPNYRTLMEATPTEAERIILSEYRRHTSGLRFAHMVRNQDDLMHSGSKAQSQSVALPPAEDGDDGKSHTPRKPPNGHKVWDVDTLRNDFVARGLRPEDIYKENNLNEDYANGHKARRAFRDGARLYFICNQ